VCSGGWLTQADYYSPVREALGHGASEGLCDLTDLLPRSLQYCDDVLASTGDDDRQAVVEEEAAHCLRQPRQCGLVAVRKRCRQDDQLARRVHAERAEPVRDLRGTLRPGQDHVEQLTREPELDRLDCLLFRDLETQESRCLLEAVLLLPGQRGDRLQADQGGIGIAHRADQEQRRPAAVEVDLQRRRMLRQSFGYPAPLIRRQLRPRRGERPRHPVDHRQRQIVLTLHHSQYSGRSRAVRDRLRQRVAAADHADQSVPTLIRLHRRRRLGHRRERHVDRDLHQRQPQLFAGIDQARWSLRCLLAQTEDDPDGARPQYVAAELHRRRLPQPEPVGQHDLALTKIRRGIRQLGVVHPQRLGRQPAVRAGDEQVELERRVLQERGETEHAVNISTHTRFH
jgi:hypothetical protein